MRKTILLILLFILCSAETFADSKTVLIAILARNKAHLLKNYLACIQQLDYDKKALLIYINTNNNEDQTEQILRSWASKNQKKYRRIIFEAHQIPQLRPTKPHEWTEQRFKALGTIRNKSLLIAKQLQCDYYFVVDCDNFIAPYTLRELMRKQKPIIAPMLTSIPEPGDTYSNFICAINADGYEEGHPDYLKILRREKIGTFEVPIVHCTYLIKADYIDQLTYVDETPHHEFVVFSRQARRHGVRQFICNEKPFGYLLHHSTKLTLEQEQYQVKKFGSLIPNKQTVFLLDL